MPSSAPTSDSPSHPRAVTLLRSGGLFVLVSVLCGLLVTALTLPFVGGAAWGAKAARDGMASLPLDANVPFLTVMANKMPFMGRG